MIDMIQNIISLHVLTAYDKNNQVDKILCKVKQCSNYINVNHENITRPK